MSPLGRLIVHPLQQSPRRLVEPVAMRYIAGDRLEDAVRVVRSLNAEKMMATLDLLGEDVSRGEEAELKPLLEAVAQALDKENEGLRLALGADDFRKELRPGREKDFLPFRAGSLFNSCEHIFISHLTDEIQDFILTGRVDPGQRFLPEIVG